jgi:hypothetical protein
VPKPLRCRLRFHAWEDRENPETRDRYQVCVRCNAYRDRGSAAPRRRGGWSYWHGPRVTRQRFQTA